MDTLPKQYYAGIGSRKTPRDQVQSKLTTIARRLDSMGYVLRSGGAHGADDAFEQGAVNKQIFLPWDGFNDRRADGASYIVPELNRALVEKYHPAPAALSPAGWKLMSRNSYQILGPTLDDPVDFVLCWTPGGKLLGGTAQAIRIAMDYNIPVFNFGDESQYEAFATFMTFQKNLL